MDLELEVNLRTVCEQAIDLGKDVYICFIDYTNAFDRVKHSKIIECLSEIRIDDKDLQGCKAGMCFITKFI